MTDQRTEESMLPRIHRSGISAAADSNQGCFASDQT